MAHIHHDADVLDRQGGFGDGGRQHHFASLGDGGDGGALLGEGERAKQRADLAMAGQTGLQRAGGTADFALAGQEHQKAPAGLAGLTFRADDQIHQRVQFACLGGQGAVEPAGFDRVAAAIGGHNGRIHQGRHRACIQRGGHRQQQEVVAQGTCNLKAEGEPQIAIEGAFVKFVEDHRANARQIRIRLQHPGQDAFGHNLNAGGF